MPRITISIYYTNVVYMVDVTNVNYVRVINIHVQHTTLSSVENQF